MKLYGYPSVAQVSLLVLGLLVGQGTLAEPPKMPPPKMTPPPVTPPTMTPPPFDPGTEPDMEEDLDDVLDDEFEEEEDADPQEVMTDYLDDLIDIIEEAAVEHCSSAREGAKFRTAISALEIFIKKARKLPGQTDYATSELKDSAAILKEVKSSLKSICTQDKDLDEDEDEF